MSPERWRQIEELYHSALERAPDQRAAFLAQACGSDDELRREVEALLRHGDSPEALVDRPAWEAAGELLDNHTMGHAPNLIGRRISHYEIIEKLGEGGMGVVYKARDSRLGRSVALKFVKAQFSERFEREARAIAALNHPHISTLYEVGEHEGARYLAMEFVEGKPLKGPRPVKEVIEYGIRIADALAAAHAAGIVHRDLKPANILLTGKGAVKILDFGIAKLTTQAADGAPATATLTGVSPGTPGYMSPEQIDGKPADARSDIFAFGCVLYELVSGRRPFEGDSISQVLGATATQEPKPLDRVPEELDKLIRRCLRKDPEHRLHHIADARIALEEINETPAPREVAPRRPRRRIALLTAGLAAAVLGGTLVGAWLTAGPAVDVTKHRYSPIMVVSHTRAISEGGGTGAHGPGWSPDGKSIVYSADGLRLQRLDGFESVRLTTEGLHPFFSADGSRIYYFASSQRSRELWSVSVAGGTPERVLSDLGGFTPLMGGAAESRDGSALVVVRPLKAGDDEMSVWVSSPPGTPSRPYPGSPTGRNLSRAFLRFSPDGSTLLLTLSASGQPVQWWLLRWPPPGAAQPNTVRRLFRDSPHGTFATSADWLSDNRHLIVSVLKEGAFGGPLWMADTVTGIWRRITSGPLAFGGPRVSRDGRVLFHMPKTEEHAIEIPLDGSAFRPLLPGLRQEQYPSWSPVADQVLFVTDQRGEPEIWLASRKEGWQRPVVTQRDFLPDPAQRGFVAPVFSPDGARIAYTSEGAIWVSPVAGGPPARICNGYCPTWSPGGQWLAFLSDLRASTPALMKVQLGRPQGVVSIRSSAQRWLPRWSPDGKWITIQLAEGFGVISPDGARTRVLYKGALDLGSACGWSRDGSRLFLAYLTPQGRVLAAFDVATGAERRVRDLGPLDFSYLAPHSVGLSPSPDGKSLAASTLSVRFEPWILDGLEPPRSFWARLFRRR